MPLARTFLDWSRPALPAVAEFLVERYGGEGVIDLSGVVVVLTGRRASRRLVEILVEQTGGRLVPPQTITEGEFPELLYEPQRPFAGLLTQHLAWAEAVRRMPRPQAERVLREVPDDSDADGWRALGELLWRLHRELAAELLDFSDVLTQGEQLTGFNERRRWEALRVAQQEYLDLLDEFGLWDKQTARIVAVQERECHTERDVVLVGAVDLNRSTRAMLDQVSDRVTALIHAPPALVERFDEFGCLRPEAWMSAAIELSRDQVRVVDKAADQADEVLRILAGLEGRYRADEITIGMADDALVPQIQRRLRQYGVASRGAVGRPLLQTSAGRLLEAAASYLESGRADHLATLVRHPDIAAWLDAQGVSPLWLQEFDRYVNEHLQQRLGFWLGPSGQCEAVKAVYDAITSLLAGLRGDRRPLPEWSPVLLMLLQDVTGDREYDPEVPADKMQLDAVTKLNEIVLAHEEIPDVLSPVVSGAQALQLTLEELAQETVPAPADETAVELAGWLELPLDDAPALVVTSFNEEFVPSSVSADLFLPDRLRRQLGVLDNDRRYARDAYALSSLLASREEVVLVAGRRDARGDPLMPSRLFFACDAEEAAERVTMFFEGKSPLPLPAFGPDSPEGHGTGIVVPPPLPLAEPVTSIRVTAFRDYLACPYRFYLRHVLDLETTPHEADEMDGRAFGTLMHEVLGAFGVSGLKHATSDEEITEFLQAKLDELAQRQYGRYRLPAVSVQLEQARRRLAAFAKSQAERTRDGWTIAFVEAPADAGGVDFPIGDGRSVLLRGRIDRIDRHEARDEWALLDYKTGDSTMDPEKAHRTKGEWTDLQLPLYRHLARELGVEDNVALGYMTLPRDTAEVRERIAPWSEADLNSADETAREVSRRILDGCFWPPAALPPGRYDDFAAVCQANVFE